MDGIVCLDTSPSNPWAADGFTVVEHHKNDFEYFDPARITLRLVESQKEGGSVSGYQIYEELKGMLVCNACVLDYLLAHPHHIPEDFLKKDVDGEIQYVFFWGTVYRDLQSKMCVRYLCLDGHVIRTGFYWLENDWRSDRLAAIYVQ